MPHRAHGRPSAAPAPHLRPATRPLPRGLLRTGQVTVTPAAQAALAQARADVDAIVARHRHAHWGDVEPARWAANDLALLHGGEVLSAYPLSSALQVWVRTTADRSVTTVMLAEER